MTKFVGRRGIFGIAKESSRGVGVSPTEWLPRVTASFEDKTDTAREAEGLGRIEDSDSNHVLRRYAEGDVEFEVNDRQIGMFLTSLIGASPVSAGGPTYTHTYTLSNTNQHQSVSIYYEDPDVKKLYPLGVVSSLEFVAEPDAIVRATANIMSKASRDWTNQTEDFTDIGLKFLQQHTQIKLASDISGLSAATALSVKSLNLTISANAENDNVLGTAEPEDILNHQFSVEGSITLNKEDDTYRGYMTNGTYRAMEINFNRASNSGLQIQFPRVDFTEWEQDRSLDDIVSQSINFKGNYDAANALAIISTCVLTNTYAGTNY